MVSHKFTELGLLERPHCCGAEHVGTLAFYYLAIAYLTASSGQNLEQVVGYAPTHYPWQGQRLLLHHTCIEFVNLTLVAHTFLHVLASPISRLASTDALFLG